MLELSPSKSHFVYSNYLMTRDREGKKSGKAGGNVNRQLIEDNAKLICFSALTVHLELNFDWPIADEADESLTRVGDKPLQ